LSVSHLVGALAFSGFDREDVAGWLECLAGDGQYSRRSIQIMRTVLRVALADATDEGLVRSCINTGAVRRTGSGSLDPDAGSIGE
jgi:hypothetical protein